MSPIISARELKSLIHTNTIILDCRYDLADTGAGKEVFVKGHIPGAAYVSLDDDLCAEIGEHGGRHPLPSVEAMALLFGRLGIVRGETPVVVYDDQGGCFAARLWWMLRYCGHDDVRVLDGGYAAWLNSGGASSREHPETTKQVFTAAPQEHLMATSADVRALDASELLIDCRAPERFRGEEEPLDSKAGHIPGAFNVPWRGMVTDDEHFASVAVMAEHLTAVDGRSIMYCGSGVTACVNVLAAEAAGLDMPRLYPGSWSDWITYPENSIELGA